ncbi:hypothetical protein BGZ73_005339 [Actinomortierella ambigua]|nr:hypothetical protein BGZ73_005339 [Actinomortierella ambigua]
MAAAKNRLLTLFSHLKSSKDGAAVISKPIISAPMNGWASPALVAAVAQAGGLGLFPVGYFTDSSKIVREVEGTVAKLDRTLVEKNELSPIGVGFITFWLERQGVDVLRGLFGPEKNGQRAFKPPAAVWFSFGDYRPYLRWVRENAHPQTRVIVQVSTVQQAVDAQNDGVDAVVLQGTEAGGHGAQFVSPLMTLLPEAVNAMTEGSRLEEPKIPVIAAGGIATSGQYQAAINMGASGAVLGTAFMVCQEAGGAQQAKDILIKARDGGLSTVRTRLFDDLREIAWPVGYDGRVVRNVVTEREEEEQAQGKSYRGQDYHPDPFRLLKPDLVSGTKQDWEKASKEQDYSMLPLFCGTGVGLLNKPNMTAAEMIHHIVRA